MSDLAQEFNEPVLLAIIGGTGLYKLDCLHPVAKLHITTPWGAPSSAITISKTASGFPIAFLARHGEHHSLTPTDVPNRANIAALKHLGVKAIVAFSAVGSLQEHIKPRDFVVPTQVIDRTKGIRPSSFFESGFVAHAGFGDPFDLTLNKFVNKVVSTHKLEGDSSFFHTSETEKNDLTLICMEGPAFSTRAESKLYRSWGGSVINMSCLPESKLAREAEIAYQMICMSTDYDAWRDDSEPVTVETVVGHLTANGENARFVATTLIEALEQPLIDGTVGNDLIGSMKFAVSTAPHARAPKVAEKIKYLFPNHYL